MKKIRLERFDVHLKEQLKNKELRKAFKIERARIKLNRKKNDIKQRSSPDYTSQELKAIERIVEQEKGKAKVFKPGKEFSRYIKEITKGR